MSQSLPAETFPHRICRVGPQTDLGRTPQIKRAMDYIDRTYRSHFRQDRWVHFLVKHKETDLCIGVNRACWNPAIPGYARRYVSGLRAGMDAWILRNPGYARSMVPYDAGPESPAIFQEMSAAARQSGIGPMSAVAGAIAQKTGKHLKEKFGLTEVMVENGGDIYADIDEDIDISVFAGNSPLSEKTGLHIESAESPLGICTSSGTVGPSLSLGKADAVMIICRDTLLADTYATAFANMIQTVEDIPVCIEKAGSHDDILAAIAIKDDKIGICGQFELRLFSQA